MPTNLVRIHAEKCPQNSVRIHVQFNLTGFRCPQLRDHGGAAAGRPGVREAGGRDVHERLLRSGIDRLC